MKILFIYRHPDLGHSIEKVFRPIEKYLKDNNVDVKSLTLPCAKYNISSIYRNLKRFLAVLKSDNYDIIQITGTEHYLIPFIKKQKVVVTLHDLGRFYDLQKIRKFKYYLLHILPLKYANKIVCISKAAEYELSNATKISKQKIVIIPDALNQDFTYIPHSFNENCPLILHIGTRPHKNLYRTVIALQGLVYKMKIVGMLSNEDKQFLKKYDVIYSNTYNLTDEEIRQEYINCDIVNFPSTHEGFGMPIIEGQSTGRVVVTSNISPMIDVAGKGASLCDPWEINSIKDAYLSILNDSDFRNCLINEGLENVKKYRVGEISNMYLSLYNQIQVNK